MMEFLTDFHASHDLLNQVSASEIMPYTTQFGLSTELHDNLHSNIAEQADYFSESPFTAAEDSQAESEIAKPTSAPTPEKKPIAKKKKVHPFHVQNYLVHNTYPKDCAGSYRRTIRRTAERNYKLVNGSELWYRKCCVDAPKHPHNVPEYKWRRVVIDPEQQRQLLTAFHVSESGEHRSRKVTQTKLEEANYWPELCHHVTAYVTSCDVCRRGQPQNSAAKRTAVDAFLTKFKESLSESPMPPTNTLTGPFSQTAHFTPTPTATPTNPSFITDSSGKPVQECARPPPQNTAVTIMEINSTVKPKKAKMNSSLEMSIKAAAAVAKSISDTRQAQESKSAGGLSVHSAQTPKVNNKMRCSVCGYRSTRRRDYVRHMFDFHVWRCRCGYSTRDGDRAALHLTQCREPSVFTKVSVRPATQEEGKESGVRMRVCGTCLGCSRIRNCGKCKHCLSHKSLGKRADNKRCVKRRCLRMKKIRPLRPTDDPVPLDRHPDRVFQRQMARDALYILELMDSFEERHGSTSYSGDDGETQHGATATSGGVSDVGTKEAAPGVAKEGSETHGPISASLWGISESACEAKAGAETPESIAASRSVTIDAPRATSAGGEAHGAIPASGVSITGAIPASGVSINGMGTACMDGLANTSESSLLRERVLGATVQGEGDTSVDRGAGDANGGQNNNNASHNGDIEQDDGATDSQGNQTNTAAGRSEAEVVKPTLEVTKPIPEVPEIIRPTAEMANPTPEVVGSIPEIVESTPEVAKTKPEIATPIPELSNTSPVIMRPKSIISKPEAMATEDSDLLLDAAFIESLTAQISELPSVVPRDPVEEATEQLNRFEALITGGKAGEQPIDLSANTHHSKGEGRPSLSANQTQGVNAQHNFDSVQRMEVINQPKINHQPGELNLEENTQPKSSQVAASENGSGSQVGNTVKHIGGDLHCILCSDEVSFTLHEVTSLKELALKKPSVIELEAWFQQLA